ncbi:dolichyl-P-Man:Man(5)GlcNAc(2)-PP-dolichol alpha-1,3-mannosyltransferase [Agyrium rufum]|nr:dolichyl-P-Man:Man(5)GlcNAc(2)-PP-dolichol alpha-1,3-mannosyltransferase [Agyrium rufum]
MPLIPPSLAPMDLLQQSWRIASSPSNTVYLAPLLFLFDALLCAVVILKIPYTEIDWSTYNQQIALFLSGEKDYTFIKGSTGPLVYPAGHVYVYSALHWATDGGEDIRLGQWIFAGVYLLGLGLVLRVYWGVKENRRDHMNQEVGVKKQTELKKGPLMKDIGKVQHGQPRQNVISDAPEWIEPEREWSIKLIDIPLQTQAPPYILPLLVLSKRLHSIFVLRLFNDCFVTIALFATIFAFQKRLWAIGAVIFSLGVSVKMSLLLAAPGVLMVLGQALDRNRMLRSLAIMAQIQVLLATPFLAANPIGYLSSAFEFSRVFLYKWTVEWRFVSEKTFLSKPFAVSLLLAHASLLVLFVTTRWTKPSGMSIPELVRRVLRPLPPDMEIAISRQVNSDFITSSILGSMAIGMLCARTLHYQFYAYIAWATPFLLWKSDMPVLGIYFVWAAQEWAWNVFPSTPASSLTVMICLGIQVIGIWYGTGKKPNRSVTSRRRAEKQKKAN